MKLRRQPSERFLIGKGVVLSRSPLSSSNCNSRLENAESNGYQINDLSPLALAETICGSIEDNLCNTRCTPTASSTPEGNRTTISPSNKSPCWLKSTGRSIISQRVRDSRETFKRYKKPIPFDMSRFTQVTSNFKQSYKCPLFGLTNTCFKDLIAEFQEYQIKLRTSNEVVNDEETPTRERIFKTPLCRSIGSNAPRRLFDSSPVSSNRISNSGDQSLSYKRRDTDYDEVDSPCLADENAPVRGFRSKVRKIDWSPTIEEKDIDSGLESMDTSTSSDCSEGLDQDLLNLSFEHCSDSGRELVNGCLKF